MGKVELKFDKNRLNDALFNMTRQTDERMKTCRIYSQLHSVRMKTAIQAKKLYCWHKEVSFVFCVLFDCFTTDLTRFKIQIDLLVIVTLTYTCTYYKEKG